jgi:8-oxo-dGTP pyrophosphatase MutT (NUDIX family)
MAAKRRILLRMPHIHTETGQHDVTVSAIVIDTRGPEPRALLHWHKKFGNWIQFGGHIELNETPWQAVAHELTEESGYDISQLKILQPRIRIHRLTGAVLHPQPAVVCTHLIRHAGLEREHFHTDLSYVFVTTEDSTGRPHEGESAELRSFTLSELNALPDSEIFENVREISSYAIETLLIEWEPVSTDGFQ